MARKPGWGTTLDEGASAAAPVTHETAPPSGRRALVVLGPHRSGTSALTRVLNLCGAELPAHIVPSHHGLPGDGNTSAGFWESKTILLLHEEMLEEAGALWDHPYLISPSWFDSEAARQLTRRLAEALAQEYQDASFIVAKDPRISLFAPLWRDALRELGFTVDWVISVRNPLATAASLAHRDAFPQSKGLSLWLSYFLAAERHTRGQRRVFVLYDDLLEDCRGVVERIERELDLPPSSLKHHRTAEIEAFLDPSLRHHEATASELLRHEGVPDLVKEGFRWAIQAAAGRADSSDPLDQIQQALRQEDEVFLPPPVSRVKVLAFYLPQYHPIPENDEWWGEGFTDWTNVTRAQPCFQGHDQPLLPSELGLYDLRLPEVRARQAELAQDYGIHGFCYYYYWFHGKKLLERPFEDVLASGEPNFPFCLCWANENWTRRWDGEDHAILIAQEHSPESDAAFIDEVMPALCDPRYIRHCGKPMLLVYRADLLADPLATTAQWREAARRAGLPGLHLCAVWRVEDPRALGFDARVEFPPHHFFHKNITDQVEGRVDDFEGEIFDYATGINLVELGPEKSFPVYRGVMPGWDNTPRRKKRAWIFAGSTPALYGKWLESVVREAWLRPGEDDQYVFVNAWNEWAEGAVLEPSKTHGRRYLEATRSAVRSVVEYQERSRQRDQYIAKQLEHLAGRLDTTRRYQQEVDETLKWLAETTKTQQVALEWLRDNVTHHDPWLKSLQNSIRDHGAVLDELKDDRTRSELHGLRQQLQETAGLWHFVLKRQSLPISRQLWLSPLYGVLGLCLKAPLWLLSGRFASRLSWWRQARSILRAGLFDPGYYLKRYPEVAASGADPLYHYIRCGASEGRDPNPFFDARRYLERHPEAAAPGANPLLHYMSHGIWDSEAAAPQEPQVSADAPSVDEPVKPPLLWRIHPQHARSRSADSRPVLVVGHDAARAGSQRILLEILKSLAEIANLELFLLLLEGGELEEDYKQHVHTFQLAELTAAGIPPEQALERVLTDFSTDRQPLLALCNTVASSEAAVTCRRLDIPVLSMVYELPTSIESAIGRDKLLGVLKSSRRVIVASRFVKDALRQSYDVTPDLLMPLHTGVVPWDQEEGARDRCRTRVLAELDLPEDTFLVLGCGTIHHRKGSDLFVQVAREVAEAAVGDRIFFLWVGADQTGPLFRQWCEHDLKAAGIEHKVRFAGPRKSTAEYFGAADVFALTSREDPFPMVNLEAMARGVPVVAFEGAGGAPEAFAEQAGITVPYLDVRAMARSIVSLWESPSFHDELRRKAQRQIAEDFQWRDYIRKMIAILESDFGYHPMQRTIDPAADQQE